MPDNYFPDPPVAQAGHIPKWGQLAKYRYENGNVYPCIIHLVLNHSDDNKYYVVAVSILHEPNESSPNVMEHHPGKVIRCGHVFWREGEFAGFVTNDPCGPPWPG